MISQLSDRICGLAREPTSDACLSRSKNCIILSVACPNVIAGLKSYYLDQFFYPSVSTVRYSLNKHPRVLVYPGNNTLIILQPDRDATR